MTVFVCSLSASPDQVIPPNRYTLLRFPFETDQWDVWGMHQAEQPDGVTALSGQDRSGLIWPHVHGWGSLTGHVQMEAGDYSEVRTQFIRDPLGLGDDPKNATGVAHWPPSPGMQFLPPHHEFAVYPGVPVGLMVRHNDTVPRRVTYAQFKLAIHPVASEAS